jgi:hypothetical protein
MGGAVVSGRSGGGGWFGRLPRGIPLGFPFGSPPVLHHMVGAFVLGRAHVCWTFTMITLRSQD